MDFHWDILVCCPGMYCICLESDYNLFLFQLKGFASDKEKETDLLMRQKNEAVKTTERIIHETDVYERKYSKQVIASAIL